jgi:hypothetical protein
MTTEQFDKLLAQLNKLADAQAAISQGKNRGIFASDRKTDEGRILKACFDGLRVNTGPGLPFLTSNPIIVDSFKRFTLINSSIASPAVQLQVLDCFGAWATLSTLPAVVAGSASSFEGAYSALRLFSSNANWPTTNLSLVRYSLIAS